MHAATLPRIIAVLLAASLSLTAQTLIDEFRDPGPDTRPGCYWYWINGNVSKEGITRDLEAMKRIGIGRAYIGHIHNHKGPDDTPVGPLVMFSEEWWQTLQWAVKEAGRCDIEIGFFNSPGWSQSGGPWIKPGQSMRYLASSQTRIVGGATVSQTLPVPEIDTYPAAGGSRPTQYAPKFTANDFQDVAVVAFPAPPEPRIEALRLLVDGKPAPQLRDGDLATTISIARKPVTLQLELPAESQAQALHLQPKGWGYTLSARIESSADGSNWQALTRHVEQRAHQGARREDELLIPLPVTGHRHLRITLENEKGSFGKTYKGRFEISELSLGSAPVLGHYVRKQLGETHPSTLPAWDAYRWPGQTPPLADTVLPSSKVIDLSDKLAADGTLNWDAPAGEWFVMRCGMVPIGTSCHPASPEGRGLEVDKMSEAHVRSHFDGLVGEFLRRTPAKDRKALKYVIADSYETGPQNWTDGMTAKFTERFGYSPLRYLPCLEGHVVDSPTVSNRFLWDLRRLIAESIAMDYVGGLRKVSNEHDLKLWLENYGHWGFPSEFLLYASQTDQVGGEFWETGAPLSNTECRAAASGAHIYGRRDVYAEAFTSNRNFKQSPADLKSWLDWVYSAGINRLILHVYIHQPDERKPGIIQWFGTAFNRHNTWFDPSKAFVDYIRRSAVLLRAGRPVADVAYYIGQSSPVMTGPLDPALPAGHDYDHINSDVLIHHATVVDGRIEIGNGPSYAILVLPPERIMTPEVAEAIAKLVEAGATVLGMPPKASPSLAGQPRSNQRVAAVATKLWGTLEPTGTVDRKFGKGRVLSGLDLQSAFKAIGITPDFKIRGSATLACGVAGDGRVGRGGRGGILYKHRSGEAHEIYFLANTTDQPADFMASFRVAGREPSFWDSVTGEIVPAHSYMQKEGRTEIPIHLEARESRYVVFGKPIANDASGPALTNHREFAPITPLAGPWQVTFEGADAPAATTFDTLADWSTHPDPEIRHFAGSATYQIEFPHQVAAGKSATTRLDLGKVGVIAEVELNGQDIDTIWTTPWSRDITEFLKPGKNTLRIRVTNTWNNRLVADSKLPIDQRKSFVSQGYRKLKGDALLPSGLIGPVTLQQPK